eukprot:COSAG06_NODE_4942_length_3842_cov_35.091638_4_plen_76_part_00
MWTMRSAPSTARLPLSLLCPQIGLAARLSPQWRRLHLHRPRHLRQCCRRTVAAAAAAVVVRQLQAGSGLPRPNPR